MNELAKLVPLLFDVESFRITDRNGEPWFLAKDACEILEIKKVGRTFKEFPDEEKAYIICGGVSNTTTYCRCDGASTDTTSGKSRRRKTQKYLIINESGLMRLILKSRKKNAWEFKERIIKLVADCRKKGINRAILAKTWSYGGEEELTHTEWRAKREKAYFRRYPNASWEDFLRSLPNR